MDIAAGTSLWRVEVGDVLILMVVHTRTHPMFLHQDPTELSVEVKEASDEWLGAMQELCDQKAAEDELAMRMAQKQAVVAKGNCTWVTKGNSGGPEKVGK